MGPGSNPRFHRTAGCAVRAVKRQGVRSHTMPKRPRQHQLEAESQHAFIGVLPRGWVYRSITPDYGLDGSVEVFDETEVATGGMFFVQLKGTDEDDLSKALCIRLRTETLAYYRTLLLPVLVVVYHAPTKSLFARHVPKAEVPESGQATQTFRLAEEDRWGDAVVSQTLELLRQLKDVGLREVLIREYYEAKRRIVWTDSGESAADTECRVPASGWHIEHYVFGRGVVESASDSFAFVAFELDEGSSRKFLPADFHELRPVRSGI